MIDEQLSTLICEVVANINGRPQTKLSEDNNDQNVLTPKHIPPLR